jgi:hypothetical protein
MYPDPLSLMATSLFETGESFCSEHPELIEQVLSETEMIERKRVRWYAREQGISIDVGVQRLIDGLALRYFTAATT